MMMKYRYCTSMVFPFLCAALLMSTVLYPHVASQAPQDFSVTEMQATCGGYSSRRSVSSAVFLISVGPGKIVGKSTALVIERESRQKRREKYLLQSYLFCTDSYSESAPSPCY